MWCVWVCACVYCSLHHWRHYFFCFFVCAYHHKNWPLTFISPITPPSHSHPLFLAPFSILESSTSVLRKEVQKYTVSFIYQSTFRKSLSCSFDGTVNIIDWIIILILMIMQMKWVPKKKTKEMSPFSLQHPLFRHCLVPLEKSVITKNRICKKYMKIWINREKSLLQPKCICVCNIALFVMQIFSKHLYYSGVGLTFDITNANGKM